MNMREIADQIIRDCLGYKKGETVTIITDKETEEVGTMLRDKSAELGAMVQYFVMEDFGDRSEDGSNPLPFPEEIAAAMKKSDISIYVATGKKGELFSFRNPMLNLINSVDRLRHGHMIGVDKAALVSAFDGDYRKVIDLTHRVHDALQGVRSAHIATPAGTNLTAKFNPNYKWLLSDGVIKPGTYSNVPSGEVYTCVETCAGHVVVDGELGDYLLRYGLLRDKPLILDIEDGRVVKVACSDKELENEVREYMKIDANGNRVGEWAIGTNINLKKLIGNFLIDEKFPGVHIALGSGYSDTTGADWDGKGHLDCILLDPTVTLTYADGTTRVILDQGKYDA